MRRSILIITAVVAIVLPVAAQQPPALQATRDLTIDAAQNKLTRIGWLGVARDGGIIVTQPVEFGIKFFAPAGTLVKTIGKEGEGNGEFTAMIGGGWIGDTIWLNDNRLRRLTLISSQQKVVRTIPLNFDVMMPTGEPVPTITLNGTSFGPPISGIFADGTFLMSQLIGLNASVPAEWHRPARPGSAYVRVAGNGVISSLVAWTPGSNPCTNLAQLCPRVIAAVAPDGGTIAFAQAATGGADSGTFTIIAINAKSDTVLARKYPFTGVVVPQQYADSLAAALAALRSRAAPPPGVTLPPPPVFQPTVFPPITALVAGRDGTIWIGQVVSNGMRPWLVLDEKGNPWGGVTLPANVTVRTADRTAIWGTERTDAQGIENIVRYSVKHP